jgi:hypothetical protein
VDAITVQRGLAAAAGVISGLNTFATLPDAIDPDLFAPVETEIDYHLSFGNGLGGVLFTCGIFTSRGDTEAGRAALADYISPTGSRSLRAAIEADKKLGGACKQLVVERARGAGRLYTIASIDYLGAMIDVRVWG